MKREKPWLTSVKLDMSIFSIAGTKRKVYMRHKISIINIAVYTCFDPGQIKVGDVKESILYDQKHMVQACREINGRKLRRGVVGVSGETRQIVWWRSMLKHFPPVLGTLLFTLWRLVFLCDESTIRFLVAAAWFDDQSLSKTQHMSESQHAV